MVPVVVKIMGVPPKGDDGTPIMPYSNAVTMQLILGLMKTYQRRAGILTTLQAFSLHLEATALSPSAETVKTTAVSAFTRRSGSYDCCS
jgi:hypothetical protein